MRWLLWCVCLLAESYETINHYHYPKFSLQFAPFLCVCHAFRDYERGLQVALLYDIRYKCQLNLSLREQPLPPPGCVRRGMSHETPFSGRGSRNAAEDLRPNILQLNTEGLTANKISVIEQLAYKNKAFIIVLLEAHCTTADKLVIPNLSLAGSILSRNHGLATFVHERLEWSLVDQSPEQSETEWLWVDAAGYKIINLYKPPRPRFTSTAIPTFPHPSLYVGDFSCQHVNWG